MIRRGGEVVVEQSPSVWLFHQRDDFSDGAAPAVETGEHFFPRAGLDPFLLRPFPVFFGVVADHVDALAVFDQCCENVSVVAQVWGFLDG